MDTLAREATRRGIPMALAPREFDLLEFLARHPGRVLSREEPASLCSPGARSAPASGR